MGRLCLLTLAAAILGPPQWQPTLLGAAAVFAALYVLACWLWPLAACRRCAGKGRLTGPDGAHARTCPRCKGSPWHTRIGVRVFHTVRPGDRTQV